MGKKIVKDVIYRAYRDLTNMTLKELKAWRNTLLSKKTSISRTPINMALRLRAWPKSKWGYTEVRWVLKKVIPYFRKRRKLIKRHFLSKRSSLKQLAMKNWGYDVKKRRRR